LVVRTAYPSPAHPNSHRNRLVERLSEGPVGQLEPVAAPQQVLPDHREPNACSAPISGGVATRSQRLDRNPGHRQRLARNGRPPQLRSTHATVSDAAATGLMRGSATCRSAGQLRRAQPAGDRSGRAARTRPVDRTDRVGGERPLRLAPSLIAQALNTAAANRRCSAQSKHGGIREAPSISAVDDELVALFPCAGACLVNENLA
jgi:hypothetical protein